MKVLCIFGTRPEAIKMAPVIRELRRVDRVNTRVCVTGQQRQMLDQVLTVFGIAPDVDLDLMQPGHSLTDLTCRIMTGVEQVLVKEKPDLVLVHGDTSTTLASSLAAYYQKISVGHIEAGLRTNNIYAPWPEEINRKLTASIAEYHFAPTEMAKANLLREGVPVEKICVTGNTVIDAMLSITDKIESDAVLGKQLAKIFDFLDIKRKLILVTGHRRENHGQGIENVCCAIERLAKRNDVEIIYPVHMNPAVQEPVRKILQGKPHVHLLDPLEYVPFVYLMKRCHVILTDSGGIQEEAPALGKPVLVMRETTERPEAVEAGTVRLVGTDINRIVQEAELLLDDDRAYGLMTNARNPYGDGKASARIVRKLVNNPPPPPVGR